MYYAIKDDSGRRLYAKINVHKASTSTRDYATLILDPRSQPLQTPEDTLMALLFKFVLRSANYDFLDRVTLTGIKSEAYLESPRLLGVKFPTRDYKIGDQGSGKIIVHTDYILRVFREVSDFVAQHSVDLTKLISKSSLLPTPVKRVPAFPGVELIDVDE